MWTKKFQNFFQVAGYLAIGLLAVYGLAMVFGGGSPAWAVGQAIPNLQADHPRVPNVLTYQGMLREPDGTPLDGTYEMTFRLYNGPIGGDLKHTEVISNAVVRDGLFTVLLGDTTAIAPDAFKGPLYISVQVGTEPEMVPRQRIAPVAYAVQLTDGVYVDESGQVGIGTTEPRTQLHVNGDAYVHGKFNVDGTLLASDFGDITGTGRLAIPRTYQVIHIRVDQSGEHAVEPLGDWDLCALLSQEVAGVDDSSGDYGHCSITINPLNGPDGWRDRDPITEPQKERPSWNMQAGAGGKVDRVICEAICLNFGPSR